MMRKSMLMRVTVFMVATLLVASCATSGEIPKGMVRTTQAQDYWETHYDLVKTMDKAVLYGVSLNTENEGVQYNLTEVRVLDGEEVSHLSQLLQLDSSYLFDVAKKTPFLPQYAWGITQGDTTVMVFVMPDAAMLAFQKEGKMKIEDYDPVSGPLNKLFLQN